MEYLFIFLMMVIFKTPLTTVMNSMASMFIDDSNTPTQPKGK